VARSAGTVTILVRNFALGASTPWKRIRRRRGRGTELYAVRQPPVDSTAGGERHGRGQCEHARLDVESLFMVCTCSKSETDRAPSRPVHVPRGRACLSPRHLVCLLMPMDVRNELGCGVSDRWATFPAASAMAARSPSRPAPCSPWQSPGSRAARTGGWTAAAAPFPPCCCR
jgi:hypothetical protein